MDAIRIDSRSIEAGSAPRKVSWNESRCGLAIRAADSYELENAAKKVVDSRVPQTRSLTASTALRRRGVFVVRAMRSPQTLVRARTRKYRRLASSEMSYIIIDGITETHHWSSRVTIRTTEMRFSEKFCWDLSDLPARKRRKGILLQSDGRDICFRQHLCLVS